MLQKVADNWKEIYRDKQYPKACAIKDMLDANYSREEIAKAFQCRVKNVAWISFKSGLWK